MNQLLKIKVALYAILVTVAILVIAIIYPHIYNVLNPYQIQPYRNDLSIKFKQSDLDFLKQQYDSTPDEYFFCLVGQKVNNVYVINSLERINGAVTQDSIQFQGIPCQGYQYIGTLHKHPPQSILALSNGVFNSLPSTQDYYTFGVLGVPLNIIQYSNNQFYGAEYTNMKALDLRSIQVTT